MKRNRRKYQSPNVKNIPAFISLGIIVIGIVVFVISLRGLSRPSAVTVEEPTMNQTEFIERLVPYSQQLQQEYGILPSIIIGQAILESDWGRSELSATYNNLFGMKSFHPDNNSVNLVTKEHVDGEWIEIKADFKVYDSWEASMKDHTLLFVNGVDWDPYLYRGVLLADNYRSAAKSLEAAGYATDPGYAQKIISVIETYELYQYDL